jgi:Fic family protein
MKELSCVLGEVRNRQGRLAGKASLLGADLKRELLFNSIALDVVKSAELEGVALDADAVLASVARQLNSDASAGRAEIVDPLADPAVQVHADVLFNCALPVTEERLFKWKRALSATRGEAAYRNTLLYEMSSGTSGYLYIQDSYPVSEEMKRFIQWMNTIHPTDPVIKAGVACLRMSLIRPFDEDNGRIARALSDMFLTRADNSPQRLYSLSSQICSRKEMYHDVMKNMRNGNLDITEWLRWYLYCLETELEETENSLTRILEKSKFWERYRLIRLNERQVKMINLLWEGMDDKLTSSCWATVNFCSPDTALRDIQDLIQKNILRKRNSGGRSTSYALN